MGEYLVVHPVGPGMDMQSAAAAGAQLPIEGIFQIAAAMKGRTSDSEGAPRPQLSASGRMPVVARQ